MATFTKNYNLKKPSPEDFVNIDDINQNMDILDNEVNLQSQKKVPHDFENPFCFPGCTVETTATESAVTEEIFDESKKLKAKKVTQTMQDGFLETVTFYNDDGRTTEAEYRIQTEKTASGYKEIITSVR